MKTKGMIIGLLAMSSLFFACANDSDASDDAATLEQMNRQADSLEMMNDEMDQKQMDLEQSTDEVDELLQDL